MNWNVQASAMVLSSYTPGELTVVLFPCISTETGWIDTSSETIRKTLSAIDSSLTCEDCKATLRVGIDRVVRDWENTKVKESFIFPKPC